jgi:hypothetical protein
MIEKILEPVIKGLQEDEVAYDEKLVRQEVFVDCTYLMLGAIDIA